MKCFDTGANMSEEFNPNVVISAPFGNYYKLLGFDGVCHTLGTYTASPRSWRTPPFGNRWWRVLSTLRYSWSIKGWKNKLGLKNPGITYLYQKVNVEREITVHDKILSIYGFDNEQWDILFDYCNKLQPLAIEINASCPNVDKPPFDMSVFTKAMSLGIPVIVKLPPVFYHNTLDMALNAGIVHFHCCNTLPSPVGGISGKPLLQISQGVVRDVRKIAPDSFIIGGGGITNSADAFDYVASGANSVAVGSMLLNPMKWRRVKHIVQVMRRLTLEKALMNDGIIPEL